MRTPARNTGMQLTQLRRGSQHVDDLLQRGCVCRIWVSKAHFHQLAGSVQCSGEVGCTEVRVSDVERRQRAARAGHHGTKQRRREVLNAAVVPRKVDAPPQRRQRHRGAPGAAHFGAAQPLVHGQQRKDAQDQLLLRQLRKGVRD